MRRSKRSVISGFGFLFICVLLAAILKRAPEEMAQSEEIQESEVISTETSLHSELSEDSVPEETVLLEVHFIDMGQSDSTLIINGEHTMLIDAADNDKGTALQLYLQQQGIEQLDYLVLTHTDADHIGGADVIITKFDIETVFMGNYEKDNATYRDTMEALEYKGMKWSTPKVGSTYALGDASFTIIAPNADYDTPNNTSIGLILEKGQKRFAFTGDAEETAENDIVKNGIALSVDVYKAGHHGSSSSSNAALLDAMSPSFAVISCGEDNPYGYPHVETLNALKARGIEVFRTDEQGSIVAVCDGVNITWNCMPSETWQSGARGK